MLGGSHYLMSYCVTYTFDDKLNLIHTKNLNTCWLPKFFELSEEPTHDELHFVSTYFQYKNCRVNIKFKVGQGTKYLYL